MIICLYGKPRAGKTTISARTVQVNKKKRIKYYKRISKSKLYHWSLNHIDKWYCKMIIKLLFKKNFYDVVYCTDETIQDTVTVTYEELGHWRPYPNSLLVLEECGLGISNREFKNLSKLSKRLAAKHGHMGLDIILSSQTVDYDKAWRQRAQINFICKKLGPFTIARRVTYSVDVNNETKDLQDAYEKVAGLGYFIDLIGGLKKSHRFAKLPFYKSFIIFRPKWYKYFDSYEDDFDYPMEDPMFTVLKRQIAEGIDTEDYYIKELCKVYQISTEKEAEDD